MELENYALVFEDDFDGDTLDLSKWEYRASGPSRCGFHAPSAVRVDNGNLIMRQEYRDGEFGEGWYAGAIRVKQRFCRGYFEIRCICNDTLFHGFWSAFWLQGRHPYDKVLSRGGIGSAEIDIIETFLDHGAPCVEFTIHCAGKTNSIAGENGLDSAHICRIHLPDCFTAYHTYALEWTEREYIFYIDGEEIARTNWGDGVSTEDEEVVVSLELPSEYSYAKDTTSEFIVDYVRIYQKRE